MEAILITALFIIAVVVDAVGDGYVYNGFRSTRIMPNTKWQKWFGWQSQNILLFLGFVVYPVLVVHYDSSILKILTYSLIGYPLMRLALFNLTWNLTTGKHWWFYGTVKGTDRILRWFIADSWIAHKIKPREDMIMGAVMIFSFLFSLVATGIWLLFPQ